MNYSRLLGGMALVVAGACFCGCEDDSVERAKTSKHLAFTAAVESASEGATRSTAATCPKDTTVELRGGDTPLYLHISYEDDIEGTSLTEGAEKKAVTRGRPITNDNMYSSFGVSGYKYTGGWTGTETPDFFYNETATKTDDGYWAMGNTYYRPGDAYNMRFFAYAPVNRSSFVISDADLKGAPMLTVTVSEDAFEQSDLLVAESGEVSGGGTAAIPLTFEHALSAVRFVIEGKEFLEDCGVSGAFVSEIRIGGIVGEGEYSMLSGDWSLMGSGCTFHATIGEDITSAEGKSDLEVGINNTFMPMLS